MVQYRGIAAVFVLVAVLGYLGWEYASERWIDGVDAFESISEVDLGDGDRIELIDELAVRRVAPEGEVWRVETRVSRFLLVEDDRVYFRACDADYEHSITHALDVATGEVVWRAPPVPNGTGETRGEVHDGKLVEYLPRDGTFSDSGSRLRAIDVETGEVAFDIALPEPNYPTLASMEFLDDGLYVVGPNGYGTNVRQWAMFISRDGARAMLTEEGSVGACLVRDGLASLRADGTITWRVHGDDPVEIARPGRGDLRCGRANDDVILGWSAPSYIAGRYARDDDPPPTHQPPVAIEDASQPLETGCALYAISSRGELRWGRRFGWGELHVEWPELDDELGTRFDLVVRVPAQFVGEEVGYATGPQHGFQVQTSNGTITPAE